MTSFEEFGLDKWYNLLIKQTNLSFVFFFVFSTDRDVLSIKEKRPQLVSHHLKDNFNFHTKIHIN